MFRSLSSKNIMVMPVLSLFMLMTAVVLTSCGGGGGGNATPTCPPCASQETSFWAANFTTNSYYCICAAEVSTGGAHSRIFVEHGRALPLLLSGLQTEFDTNIYPADTSNFGSEPNPGIDNDPLITILLLNIKDGLSGAGSSYVAGYFDQGNEYPLSANPYSNRREMFYLNINPILINSPSITAADFYTILAHEFQHMIHWEQKTHLKGLDDDTWLDEAMSEAAPTYLYGPSCERLYTYEQDPSNSLTIWNDSIFDYGIAYMWSQYYKDQFDQFGGSIFKRIMQQNSIGISSVTSALASLPSNTRTFDSTFYDMSIAIASGITTSTRWPGHPEWTYSIASGVDTLAGSCGSIMLPGLFSQNTSTLTTLPALGPWSVGFSSFHSSPTGTITWTAASSLKAAFIDGGNNRLATNITSGSSNTYSNDGYLLVSNPSGGSVSSGGSVVRSSVSTLAPAMSLSPKQMLAAENAVSQALGRPRSVCVQSAFREREKEMRRKGFKPGF
jgi:hypothetical protein